MFSDEARDRRTMQHAGAASDGWVGIRLNWFMVSAAGAKGPPPLFGEIVLAPSARTRM